MDSQNPFDLFPPEASAPPPDPPEDERNPTASSQSSPQFHSAFSEVSPSDDTFRLTPSEVSSYRREFGPDVTLPGYAPSDTTSTTPLLSSRDDKILSRLDTMNDNIAALTSTIGSLVTHLQENHDNKEKATPPLEELSSTGITYSNPPQPLKMTLSASSLKLLPPLLSQFKTSTITELPQDISPSESKT